MLWQRVVSSLTVNYTPSSSIIRSASSSDNHTSSPSDNDTSSSSGLTRGSTHKQIAFHFGMGPRVKPEDDGGVL